MPEVSVIIPNFNHADWLAERIRSVLEQSFRNFELILLDDASTDGSRQVIETYREHPAVTHVLYNEKNSGSPFRQWQTGLDLATGKWTWIAESDDSADEKFLETLITLGKTSKDISFVYCNAAIRNRPDASQPNENFADLKNKTFNTQKWSAAYYADGMNELNEYLKWQCTVNNVSSVIFDSNKLRAVLPLAQDYRYHGDWLLYLALCQVGTIAYCPETLNHYRDHPDNHSKSENYIFHSKRECFRILDYLLQQENVSHKGELLDHFVKKYIGYGLLKENSIYREYRSIHPSLARKVRSRVLKNKLGF